MPKSQKEIKALQKKLDKISMQLMKRYETLRSAHSKLLRKGLKSGYYGKSSLVKAEKTARTKMEKAHSLLQFQLRLSGNNRRRIN